VCGLWRGSVEVPTKPRALVLATGKAIFARARQRFTDQVSFVDVVAGRDVPGFTPDPGTVRAFDAIMARTPFRYVVATSESNMAFAGFLRSRYGLAGFDHEDSTVATNKWRMKQAVAGGIPVAAGWLSGDFLELRSGRPEVVVVKPLSSSAARGVRRLPVADALEWLRSRDELFLVEQALPVTGELHCDGVVRDGELRLVVVSAYDRPVLRSFGTRASMHLPLDDPRVAPATEATRRVVRSLPHTDYVFHLELLQVGDELVFGEVGLRPAGTGIAESIERCFGVSLWSHFVGMQVGLPMPVEQVQRSHDGLLSGVIMGRPSEAGAPLGAEEAARLPGITGTGPGNLEPGAEPDSMCSYHYLAFFEDVSHAELRGLVDTIGGTAVPSGQE